MGHKRLNTIRELARQMRSLEKSPANVERNSFRSFDAERGARVDLMENAEWQRMEIRSTLAECGVVEWMADGPGCGAAATALALTGRIAARPGAIVVVDPQREFYPPGAAAIGIDLSRLVVVRPSDQSGALWAFEQALRCRGVQTALLRRGPLDDRASRRLQLAVEQGGGLGLLIRPACFRRQTSWADVRLLVRAVSAESSPLAPRVDGVDAERCFTRPPHSRDSAERVACISGSTRRLHIEVLFRRGAVAGGAAIVEFCHETGDVRVVPELARATRPPRAVGA
jgi:hypothetical protein